MSLIEELEKLATLIAEPLEHDLAAATAKGRAEGEAAAKAAAPPPPQPTKSDAEWEREKREAVAKARADATTKAKAAAKAEAKAASERSARDAIDSLLDLIYFAHAFDPYMPFHYERHACMSYAAIADAPVTGEDLDAIGILGKLLTTRPFGAAMNHKDALARCKELAGKYVLHPRDTIPHMGVTFKDLKDKLAVVKRLEYYQAVPNVPQAAVPPTPPLAASLPQAMAPPLPMPMAPVPSMPVVNQVAPGSAPAPAPLPVALPVPVPTAPAPSLVPLPAITPESAASSGQNLVTHFFGPGAGHAPEPVQQHQAWGPAAFEEEALPVKPVGPPAFTGDSELGIEDVELSESLTPTSGQKSPAAGQQHQAQTQNGEGPSHAGSDTTNGGMTNGDGRHGGRPGRGWGRRRGGRGGGGQAGEFRSVAMQRSGSEEGRANGFAPGQYSVYDASQDAAVNGEGAIRGRPGGRGGRGPRRGRPAANGHANGVPSA